MLTITAASPREEIEPIHTSQRLEIISLLGKAVAKIYYIPAAFITGFRYAEYVRNASWRARENKMISLLWWEISGFVLALTKTKTHSAFDRG